MKQRVLAPHLQLGEDDEPTTAWRLLTLTIFVVYAAIRVLHLSHFAMSHDEVFSAEVARMPWGAMMRAVIADVVHPPLFYILLKLWILVGGASVFWMRLLPCILSLFMVIPLQGLCNELMLSRGAIAVVLVLATFNPLLIRYSQEVRMYSLLALLSVTSLWLFTRFLNREKDATVLGFLLAINLLLIYTHYYGFFCIGSQFVVACAWTNYHSCDARLHKVRRYLLSLLMLGLAFSPWALVVIRAALRKGGLQDNLDWILVPTIKDVAWFYQTLNGANPLDTGRSRWPMRAACETCRSCERPHSTRP